MAPDRILVPTLQPLSLRHFLLHQRTPGSWNTFVTRGLMGSPAILLQLRSLLDLSVQSKIRSIAICYLANLVLCIVDWPFRSWRSPRKNIFRWNHVPSDLLYAIGRLLNDVGAWADEEQRKAETGH